MLRQLLELRAEFRAFVRQLSACELFDAFLYCGHYSETVWAELQAEKLRREFSVGLREAQVTDMTGVA